MGLALCVFLIAPATAEAAPTRAEYLATVDPLCKERNERTKRAVRGFGSALKAERFRRAARILRRANRVYSQWHEPVVAVEPPAADVAIIQRWLDLIQEDLSTSRRNAAALAKGKLGRFYSLIKRSRGIVREVDRLLADYGFAECN